MTRADYIASLCARLDQAVRVPFEPVSVGDWSPKVAECHQNADRWVEAHPDFAVVRGWVTYASFGELGCRLTAHSVVRRGDMLLDITPLEDDAARRGMHFLTHDGSEELFSAVKAGSIFIDCLTCEADALDNWSPEMPDDEDE